MTNFFTKLQIKNEKNKFFFVSLQCQGCLSQNNEKYFQVMFRVILIGFLLMLRFTSTACLPPDPNVRIQINAVSVNQDSNHIVVFWTPNLSLPNVYGYEIYVGPAAGAGTGVMVSGRNQDSLILQRLADTNMDIRLAMINRCGDSVVRGVLSDSRRVFSCEIIQRYCERKISISWSGAIRSIRDTIVHFEIWVSRDHDNCSEPNYEDCFELVKTVDASRSSAVIDAVGHEQIYKIFVRAVSVSNGDTVRANSIADTLTLLVAPVPDTAYIRVISVIDHRIVEIYTQVDTTVVWGNLYFFANDSLLKTVTYNDFLTNTDKRFLLPRIEHAFYHFKISDTCGIVVRHSDTARPILLEAELLGTTVYLDFWEYVGWEEVPIHHVFQILNGDTTLIWTGFPPSQPSPITFSDLDFAQIMNLIFFVVAYKISPIYGIIDSTRSNVVEVISLTRVPVHFATAFAPNSDITPNRTFRPIFIPQPNDRMRFKIFNTFGQIVFSATDPSHEGWDGRFNNTDVQPGIYTYQFELIRGNIPPTKKQGAIMLIR